MLTYEKNIDHAIFKNNLSPLHWENSNAIEITNKDVLKKLNDFCQPVFKSLPVSFSGFDIIEDDKGKLWLLEINTSPGFDHFIKDNGDQKIISIYKYMIKDFISLLNTK